MPIIGLHPKQLAFHQSKALFRALCGGRGSGKSRVLMLDALLRGISGPAKSTYLIAAPTYTMLEDITLPTFMERCQELGVVARLKRTPRPNVYLPQSRITYRFRSSDEPDKLRGPNLSGAALEEASLMDKEAYDIVLACLREGGMQIGWLSAAFTPRGTTHWTAIQFGKPQPNTEVFFVSTRENPWLPPGFEETLRKQYVGRYALQELEGQFVQQEGAEWPGDYFDHPDLYFHSWPNEVLYRVLALDPSKGKGDRPETPKRSADYSAFVWAALTQDGIMYVDASLDNRRDTVQIVQDGVALCREFQPHGFVIEVNQFQSMFAAEFRREGDKRNIHLPLYGIKNVDPKVERIRSLGTYLAQRKIRFKAGSAGAELLLAQLRDFPVGVHDDGPDALHMAERMLFTLIRGTGDKGPQLLRA
jgi:predicted phage terminase large subunit-like protein